MTDGSHARPRAARVMAGARIKPKMLQRVFKAGLPTSVGPRVALFLALVFMPVAAIMVGVASLAYREAIHRQDAVLLDYVARLDERRASRIARSGRLARALALQSRLAPERCQDQLEALAADEVWYAARVLRSGEETGCRFDGTVRPDALRVVHTLSAGTLIEASLKPYPVMAPVALPTTVAASFAAEWRAVSPVPAPQSEGRSIAAEVASPPWALTSWPLATDDGPARFEAVPGNAPPHRYVVGPRDAFGVTTVAALPASDFQAGPRARLITTVGLLLTILLLGIVSAWIAMERVVLGRLRAVQAVAGRLAVGDLTARVTLDPATPDEIRDLGTGINRMASSIERRTSEVEGAVAEQRRILRELHHRVKNNFQVIGSLLSLQRRALPKDAGQVLKYPEDHVAAMATAYRISYATDAISDVPLRDLVDQVVGHLLRSSGLSAKMLEGTRAIEGVRVDLDTAVALGLLITEIVAPLLEEAAGLDTAVRLDMLAGVSGLNVLVAGPAPSSEGRTNTLPRRFQAAFLAQVDGEMDVHREGPIYRARIRVPVTRLTFAHQEDETDASRPQPSPSVRA